MIIKGKSRAGPTGLAAHLGNAEKNETVTLLETKGTIAKDLRGALVEMDAYAAGTQCVKSLYHGAISPQPPHRLTPEQRDEAIAAFEEKFGLTGHARVVVMHEKLGREHIHVVWSRIDLDTMRAASDSLNFRKHEEVARDLERRFGHEKVQGAHAERDGVERPDRTPSRAELRQEERTGIKGKDVKAEVTAAFRASDGPEAFQSALEDKGYQLAKGDRRDFVIVDRAGGIHSLARRIDGVKAAELRVFMASLDRESLPTVEEAKEIAFDREHGGSPAADFENWDDALAASAIEMAKTVDGIREANTLEGKRQDSEHDTQTADNLAWEDALASAAITKADEIAEEQKRRPQELKESRDEAKLAAAYARGDDFASQTNAAQRDHERRQKRLDEGLGSEEEDKGLGIDFADEGKKEIEAAFDQEAFSATQRQNEAASHASASSEDSIYDGMEITDAVRQRMERFNSGDEDREHDEDLEPDRQHEAPGGGRTRSQ